MLFKVNPKSLPTLIFSLLISATFYGIVGKGSRRWLNLGGLVFQPSELIKILVIITLAKFFDENDNYRKRINKPFKIVVGNADAVKGAYNGNEIDFIANANRLTRVNIINFDENELD